MSVTPELVEKDDGGRLINHTSNLNRKRLHISCCLAISHKMRCAKLMSLRVNIR
jgi:hypothetical protein